MSSKRDKIESQKTCEAKRHGCSSCVEAEVGRNQGQNRQKNAIVTYKVVTGWPGKRRCSHFRHTQTALQTVRRAYVLSELKVRFLEETHV